MREGKDAASGWAPSKQGIPGKGHAHGGKGGAAGDAEQEQARESPRQALANRQARPAGPGGGAQQSRAALAGQQALEEYSMMTDDELEDYSFSVVQNESQGGAQRGGLSETARKIRYLQAEVLGDFNPKVRGALTHCTVTH